MESFDDCLQEKQRPANRADQDGKNQRQIGGQAAYRTLTYVYPNQEPDFAAMLIGLGLDKSASRDPRTPAGIGNLRADAAIDSREVDGSNLSRASDR